VYKGKSPVFFFSPHGGGGGGGAFFRRGGAVGTTAEDTGIIRRGERTGLSGTGLKTTYEQIT